MIRANCTAANPASLPAAAVLLIAGHLLLGVIFLRSSIPALAYQADSANALCIVKGTVVDALAGIPLRKAVVRLRNSTTGQRYPVITGETGKFIAEDMEPGSYTVEAAHQGYNSGEFTDTHGRAARLQLAAGETVDSIIVKLIPQAVVTGRVVDDDGDPWISTAVVVYRMVSRHGRKQLQAVGDSQVDDQGQFRIAQLSPGTYYVSAAPNPDLESRNRPAGNGAASLLQATWYPNSREIDGAVAVTLGPGQQLSSLEIRLQRGTVYRIRGRIYGAETLSAVPNSSPFGVRNIRARPISRVEGSHSQGSLKANGTFEIPNLPPGPYELYVGQGLPQTILGRTEVHVDDKDVDDVRVDIVAPRPLRGTIRIEGDRKPNPPGPGGLYTSIFSPDGGSPQSAPVQEDGTFAFALVSPARYQVKVGGLQARGRYIKELRFGDTESADGTVDIGETGGDLALTLGATGGRIIASITGLDAVQTPQVVLIREGRQDGTRVAVADQNGVYALDNLAPGDYKLYAFEDVPDGSWEDADFLKEISSLGIKISLKEGETNRVDVPLLLRSALEPVVRKLGLE